MAVSTARSPIDAAGAVDSEHAHGPPEPDPCADAHRQVEYLGVAVRGAESREELVVEVAVVEREPLGVLDRELLPLISAMRMRASSRSRTGTMLCSYTAWLSAPAPMPISGRSFHIRTSGSDLPSGMSMRGNERS
jgi:hypothetical protein